MVDPDILSRKISSLREYLRHLEEDDDITWSKYYGHCASLQDKGPACTWPVRPVHRGVHEPGQSGALKIVEH